MFQDIRSFFSVAKPKANGAPTVAPVASPSVGQKRKTILLDSDSDDEEPRKANTGSLGSKLSKNTAGKKRRIVSSDEDEPDSSRKATINGSKSTTTAKKDLKPVDALGAFGGSPIKRVEKQKKAKATEKDIFNDSVADDLELMDVDESLLNAKKTSPGNNNVHKDKPKKEQKVSPKKEESKKSPEKKKEFKEPSSAKSTPKKSSDANEDSQSKNSSSASKRAASSSAKKEKKTKEVAREEQDELDQSCKKIRRRKYRDTQ